MLAYFIKPYRRCVKFWTFRKLMDGNENKFILVAMSRTVVFRSWKEVHVVFCLCSPYQAIFPELTGFSEAVIPECTSKAIINKSETTEGLSVETIEGCRSFVLNFEQLLHWLVDWLRAGRSGIESRWERDFPPVQTGPGAHPASCKVGTGSFPGVKCGRGVLLTTHPLLVPRSWKSRAIPLPTLWATPGL